MLNVVSGIINKNKNEFQPTTISFWLESNAISSGLWLERSKPRPYLNKEPERRPILQLYFLTDNNGTDIFSDKYFCLVFISLGMGKWESLCIDYNKKIFVLLLSVW